MSEFQTLAERFELASKTFHLENQPIEKQLAFKRVWYIGACDAFACVMNATTENVDDDLCAKHLSALHAEVMAFVDLANNEGN